MYLREKPNTTQMKYQTVVHNCHLHEKDYHYTIAKHVDNV